MSDSTGGGRPDDDPDEDALAARVDELAAVLSRLERELESGGRPTPRRLVRFTREVTIPAVILLLRTNIEALRLLQRALSFADEEEGGRLGARAEEAGRTALEGVDEALGRLGEALAGRPEDRDARALLEEARDLQADIERGLEGGSRGGADGGTSGVDVDVDSELQSIKDDVDDDRAE